MIVKHVAHSELIAGRVREAPETAEIGRVDGRRDLDLDAQEISAAVFDHRVYLVLVLVAVIVAAHNRKVADAR